MKVKPVVAATKRLFSKLASQTPSVLCDTAGFCGAGSIAYGAWLIYAPVGFIVGGILAMALGALFGARLDRSKT